VHRKPIQGRAFSKPKYTTIDAKHYPPIIEAMHEVFKTGTGRGSKIDGIEIAGKTGTAENFVRIDGVRKQLADHSILIAFAPKDTPKIAIAVYVENGGYGSTIAAPITSLLIEKYLHKKISKKRKWVEKRILNLSLQHVYDQKRSILKKISTP
jgi:penicillin-binding protein 2